MYFGIYGLRNTWLGKCLKSGVSEEHLTGNVGSGPKHCFSLKESTFTIFIDQYESN